MSLKRRPPAGNVRRVAAIAGNLRGVITNKTGRVVQFESFAERSLLLQLDRDPGVRDYSSQPETFQCTDREGKEHRYTPDFIVWRDDATEIHEVTLTSRRTHPPIQFREQLAGEICRTRGWLYIVHTEETLPQGSELANLLALLRYRPTACGNQQAASASIAHLETAKMTSLQQLLSEVMRETHLPHSTIVAAVCHLLWHGKILTDFHTLLWSNGILVPTTTLWLPTQEEHCHEPIP